MLLAIPMSGFSQKKNMRKFYRKYKHVENSTAFTVPGFLIKMGSGIGRLFVKDPDARAALKFAKRFRRMRFLVMEDGNSIRKEDIKFLLKGIKTGKNPFDDFITVRNGDTNVTFLIKEKNDFIRSMFILVKSDDSFVMMELRSKFKIEHLNQMLQHFSDEMNIDIPVKTATPKPKPKIPQV